MDKNKIIQNAQKFIQKGQLDKAIREYQKIVEADPKDVRTRLKIGDLYAKKGESREAADTYLMVAEAYSQQGFFLKAVAVYKQILKLDPNLVDVNLKLAELYQQLGLMSDAMAQYQSVAHFYERSGNIRASFQTLERMLELEPDNVASRIKLAEMYSKEGMAQEAVDQFRQAADYLKANNRVDDWVKVVERLVYHEPGEVALTRELANVYLAKGDTKRALAKLQVCFKADPRDVETLHLLAQAFLELGQPSKTVSVYKELAKIYGDEGDLDQQRATWRKVLEVAPEDPEAQAALGVRPEPAAVPAAGPPPGAVPPSGPPPGARPPSGPPPGAQAPAAPAPPPAAPAGAEAIGKLLTETDVYVKYGLHDKAVEHLKKIFALDPQNLSAHEKAKELFKQAGNGEAAGQELVTLIQLTREQDPAKAKGYLNELVSVAPHLPEVSGFVAELGQPEGEQVSFLDAPPVPEEDEIVIADDEDEVLVAEGDDFGEDEAFVVATDEDDFGIEEDEEIFVAEDDELGVQIEPPTTTDFELQGVELDDGGGDAAALDVDDSPFEVETGAVELDDGALELDDGTVEFDAASVEIDAGLDDGAIVLEDDEAVDGGSEDGAFVIDDSLLEADLESAVAEAEASMKGGAPDAGGADDELLPFDDRAEDLGGGVVVDESLYADPEGTALDGAVGVEVDVGAGLEAEPASLGEAEVGFDVEADTRFDLDDAAEGVAVEADDAFALDDGEADGGIAAEAAEDELEVSDAEGKSPEEIADELEEAEFFLQQGLPDEAREVLSGILATRPDHPDALRLLAQLDAGGEVADAVELEDEAAPEGAADDEAGFEDAGFDDFDLAGELAEELAGLEGDDGLAAAPLEDFQISADDVFAEFKKGVAKTVSGEDAETHYDLGIAYREMGLVRDAISEFEVSAKQPNKHVESLTMVGVCYRELGEHAEALRVFQGLSGEEGLKPDAQKSVWFELGDCHQQLGDVAEAGWYYRKVRAVDPKFRDVLARLEQLGEADVDEGEEPPPGIPRNGAAKAPPAAPAPEKRKSGKVGYL